MYNFSQRILFGQFSHYKHYNTSLDGIYISMDKSTGNKVILEFPCASVSKRVFEQNLPYKHEFDLDENESQHIFERNSF